MVYNQEYDDMIHRTQPESPEAMAAFHHHIDAFDRLTKCVKANWADHDTMVVWASDHGNHMNDQDHGAHGEDCPRDINVMHYYGIYPKKHP